MEDHVRPSGSPPPRPPPQPSFSFKRRTVGTTPNATASPSASERVWSFSGIFRRTSGVGEARENPPRHLAMPPGPNYTGAAGESSERLLSPSSRRSVSASARRSSNYRRASAATSNRGGGGGAGGGAARSSGGGGSHLQASPSLLLGSRIQEWQQRSARSPGGNEESPSTPLAFSDDGVDEDEDDDGDEFNEDGLLPREPEFTAPEMLPSIRTPEYQTPLPKIAITVLGICMVGEFLSSSVGGPFLFFMLEDLGVPGGGGESAVGLWAGIVCEWGVGDVEWIGSDERRVRCCRERAQRVFRLTRFSTQPSRYSLPSSSLPPSSTPAAVFFLSQFATALLWSSVSLKIGRRAVLFLSLLGNTIALLLYGTCSSVWKMIIVRILAGACNGESGVMAAQRGHQGHPFDTEREREHTTIHSHRMCSAAGAVGVARSAVKDITDSTNEGRAYAVMGLCWSLGGILGPILGGWLEHPVENIPSLFSNSALFSAYPYLLPCLAAGCVTGTGCLLSTFLSYDGGPREGRIRLPEEKDLETAVNTVAALPKTVKKKVSGYFAGATTSTPTGHNPAMGDTSAAELLSPNTTIAAGGGDTSALPLSHRPSRTSFAIPHHGSAYGYDPVKHRETALSRYRRLSAATSTRYAPDYEGIGGVEPVQLNFAQR